MGIYINEITIHRLLDKSNLKIQAQDDGKAHHFILTGPNGAGKTTLFNALAKSIDSMFKNTVFDFADYKQKLEFYEASISGRYYGMDRDNRFDRVKKSYDVMTKPSLVVDVKKVWKSSQKNKITDEFIVPTATIENGFIEDNDGIIFFNFRPDRLRELASAFTNDKYECFDRCKINNLKVVSMMHVTDTVLCPYAFELPKIKNTLGEYISKKGFTQLRIAENK